MTLENEKNIFYTGEPLTPDVIVVAGGNELKQGIDYTLSYENNLNAGRGTILVSGQRALSGRAAYRWNFH